MKLIRDDILKVKKNFRTHKCDSRLLNIQFVLWVESNVEFWYPQASYLKTQCLSEKKRNYGNSTPWDVTRVITTNLRMRTAVEARSSHFVIWLYLVLVPSTHVGPTCIFTTSTMFTFPIKCWLIHLYLNFKKLRDWKYWTEIMKLHSLL